MIGRRHAWCPRCDEVRQARPGAACPVCSARLVGLPRVSTSASWQAGWGGLQQQARSLLPALRATALAVVVLGLLAGGFIAGRAAAPARATPAAPATTTPPSVTLPDGRVLAGSIRDLGWHATSGKVSLLLRTVLATRDSTNLTFEATGLDPDWRPETLGDVHVLDGQGRELALNRPSQDLPVFRSREEVPGAAMISIALGGRVEPSAVARVTVGRLVLARRSEESLTGTLVDAALKRSVDQAAQGPTDLPPASCPSCRLLVRCEVCQSLRLAGTAYRHGQVTLLLAPTRRSVGETLGSDVIIFSASGQLTSMVTTLEDGGAMISFSALQLAQTSERGQATMPFGVTVMLNRTQVAQGPWQLDQRSGSR